MMLTCGCRVEIFGYVLHLRNLCHSILCNSGGRNVIPNGPTSYFVAASFDSSRRYVGVDSSLAGHASRPTVNGVL